MKARQLISGRAFGPDALSVVAKAFDDAWVEIEPSVTGGPERTRAAKLSLLNIVVSLAKYETTDPDPVRNEAVRIFQLKRPFAN
jgi:hypothetical protein